jgi:hypothetical protein
MKILGNVLLFAGLMIGSVDLLAAGNCTANALGKTQKNVHAFVGKVATAKDPWSLLRSSFKDHRECMKMYETYDFGEAVRKVMLTRWEVVGDLEKYKIEDSAYYSFVLEALKDETADQEDIKKNTEMTSKCPSNATAICADIKKAQ